MIIFLDPLVNRNGYKLSTCLERNHLLDYYQMFSVTLWTHFNVANYKKKTEQVLIPMFLMVVVLGWFFVLSSSVFN